MSKIKLYENFEHLTDRGVVWLYSDTHFCDSDCKLMDTNWPSPEEQVKLINSKVGKNDVLILLGDVGDVSYVKKLKGYKILITGNHDRGVSNYTKEEYYEPVLSEEDFIKAKKDANFISIISILDEQHAYFNNRLFDEVYDGPVFINSRILLSHEPIDLNFGINIHGHVHDDKNPIKDKENSRSINVCSNVIGYMPVRLDKIVEGCKATDIHRVTVDNATERKSKR